MNLQGRGRRDCILQLANMPSPLRSQQTLVRVGDPCPSPNSSDAKTSAKGLEVSNGSKWFFTRKVVWLESFIGKIKPSGIICGIRDESQLDRTGANENGRREAFSTEFPCNMRRIFVQSLENSTIQMHQGDVTLFWNFRMA